MLLIINGDILFRDHQKYITIDDITVVLFSYKDIEPNMFFGNSGTNMAATVYMA